MARKILRIFLWGLLVLVVLFGISVAWNWETIQRVFLGGVKVYETTAPKLPDDIKRPAVLVFSKTNGFRHEEAIPAANALFKQFADEEGWGYFQTENGATFDKDILSRFDAVVFNNVSGDVFTAEQKTAFRDFLQNGGGFVGIHGSGGDMSYDWKWYVNDLIGAQFIGHTMDPQFQQATVRVEDRTHPGTEGLPAEWKRSDEWYSFEKSPRRDGFHILATLDEGSYRTVGMMSQDLSMGDHPIMWWHCIGKGRVLYSALGHKAEAYSEPDYRKFLLGATEWAMGLKGEGCGKAPTSQSDEKQTQQEAAR